MMILERYIQREVLEKLFGIIILLVLILTSHRFIDYLAEAAAGRLPAGLLLNMLLLKMLAVLPRLLPIAIFLAVILALTRLSGDRETVIMRAAGLSGSFQLVSVLKLAAFYTVAVLYVSFVVSPWAESELQVLKTKARQEADITGIASGRFKEFSNGDRVVYVGQIEDSGRLMKDVFLQVREDGRTSLLTSDRARFDYDEQSGSRYIVFENGRRYVTTDGRPDYRITRYHRFAQLISLGEVTAGTRKLEAIPNRELLSGSEPEFNAELQWRLAYVIASVLLPLLAVGISRYSFGNNRYVALIICILTYFIYSNLLSISKTLVIREFIPGWMGLWWVHLALGAVTVFLMKYRDRPFRSNRRRIRTAGESR